VDTDDLSFEPIPEFHRYRRGDRDVMVPHERTAAFERLTSGFAGEADAIRIFYDVIVEMRGALLDFVGAGERSLRSLISFTEPDLRSPQKHDVRRLPRRPV
jgi:hypothetical protein